MSPSLTIASTDFIHEAQISCVITGSDDWRWTAYCFVDTYFDEEDSRESLVQYAEHRQNGGFESCPLTRGTCDASLPIWSPRYYFLRVLEVRTSQVVREWHNTVSMLARRIEDYVSALLRISHLAPQLSSFNS